MILIRSGGAILVRGRRIVVTGRKVIINIEDVTRILRILLIDVRSIQGILTGGINGFFR